MKNIYNLITDAFVRIGKDESEYSITIQYTESIIDITIKPLNTRVTGTASITLLLDFSNELLDYYGNNDLFDDWDRFCEVFEWQI
jgi:hypothetical protein